MDHWTKGLSADERAVLQAALIYSQTGLLPAVTACQIELSAVMTEELDAASRDRAANLPTSEIESLRARFYATFREHPYTLNEIFEEDPVVFYPLWEELGVAEDLSHTVDSKSRRSLARMGGSSRRPKTASASTTDSTATLVNRVSTPPISSSLPA